LKKTELQPKDLAEICGIKKSTLNGYLKDQDAFPPARIDPGNGYRYYSQSTVPALNLLKAMRKRPFRLKEYEIKPILTNEDSAHLYDLYLQSNEALYGFLRNKGYL